ncbi:MAG TPA: Rrf2 family transcriptional regulator [Tepidisphaeraceae bacterium]|nr:Rrf2 family transcriptional regulator [Tepidisphaeraceae bacterium]
MTEYALLGLMHIAQSPSGKSSAREIAEAFNLPAALVCKILKCLHQRGLLGSERGMRGGYRLAVDLSDVSLAALMRMLRRAELGDRPAPSTASHRRDSEILPTAPVLLALHRRLEGVLGQILLSDLIIPGRRIDVPVESIGIERKLREVLVAQ